MQNVLLEDFRSLALAATLVFKKEQHALAAHTLSQDLAVVGSGEELIRWLGAHEQQTVQLIILDYMTATGPITEHLPTILSHRALTNHALVIGWSRHDHAAQIFREAGLHGFISKDRLATKLIEDLLTIKANRDRGASWCEVR